MIKGQNSVTISNPIKINEFVFNPHLLYIFDNVPGNIQMEITDLQCNSGLKEKYNVRLFDFYSKYMEKNTFPTICSHALKMVSPFGSTYLYKQVFQG